MTPPESPGPIGPPNQQLPPPDILRQFAANQAQELLVRAQEAEVKKLEIANRDEESKRNHEYSMVALNRQASWMDGKTASEEKKHNLRLYLGLIAVALVLILVGVLALTGQADTAKMLVQFGLPSVVTGFGGIGIGYGIGVARGQQLAKRASDATQ